MSKRKSKTNTTTPKESSMENPDVKTNPEGEPNVTENELDSAEAGAEDVTADGAADGAAEGTDIAGSEEAPAASAETEVAPAAAETPVAPPAPAETPKDPEPVVAPAPVVQEVPAADEHPLLTHLKQLFPNLKELPANVVTLASLMDAYVAAMRQHTPISPTQGAVQQRNLFNAVNAALGAAENHDIAIEAILYYFHTYRAEVFSTRLLFRFLPATKIAKKDMDAFQTILHIFQTGAEKAGRDIRLKTVDFGKAAAYLTPVQAERLLSFFRFKG